MELHHLPVKPIFFEMKGLLGSILLNMSCGAHPVEGSPLNAWWSRTRRSPLVLGRGFAHLPIYTVYIYTCTGVFMVLSKLVISYNTNIISIGWFRPVNSWSFTPTYETTMVTIITSRQFCFEAKGSGNQSEAGKGGKGHPLRVELKVVNLK